MKKFIGLFIVLISLVSEAQLLNPKKAPTWDDMTMGVLYLTEQDIPMGEDFKIPAGTGMVFVEVEYLTIPVVYLKYKDISNCRDLSFKTAMHLFNPNPDDVDDNSIGIEYATNCEVAIYVESKDFYEKSIFQ